MGKVSFYTKENCMLCEEALSFLEIMQSIYEFELDIRDIETNEAWLEEFHLAIPVIQVQDAFLYGNEMEPAQIEAFLQKGLA